MGQVASTTITALTVVNADIAVGAGIVASKVTHQTPLSSDFGLATTATPTTSTRLVYVARGVAALRDFSAVLIDTGTATTNIDFDLLINGVSALAAAVNFTNADTDGVAKAGTINTTALAAGDRVTLKCTVTTSTGALGPFAQVHIDSNYV